MIKKMYKRYFVIGVIVLLLGFICVPSISGYIEKTSSKYIKYFKTSPIFNPSSKWIEETKLLASNGEANDNYGQSVSLDGDYALIGACGTNDHEGSAYVYKRYGSTWIFQDELTASDGEFADMFGSSVSLDGNYALIGTYRDDNFIGSAYVFKREGFNWIQQDKLTASDGEEFDLFGYSVSIDGDYALIGALMDDNYIGSAYVFKRDGTTWIEEDKLIALDGEEGDMFGASVSLDGDYALIGAPEGDYYKGSVYVFKRDGSTWMEEDKLSASDGESDDNFGCSVSLDGDYALIGAYKKEIARGAAYIFKRDGSTWMEEDKLTALEGETHDYFGITVSIDADYALIGATGDLYDIGAAYVFKQDGTTWKQEDMLSASDGENGDYFACSVSLDGDYALIGAFFDDNSRGSAYVFRKLHPDLYCHGRINWIDVNPGDTLNNSFIVKNIGEEYSRLDWEITNWPEWGNWTFLPSSGVALTPEDGEFKVNVSVVAPNIIGEEFFGNITITSLENSSDFDNIPVYLKTPRSKIFSFDFTLFTWLFGQLPKTFHKLMQLLRG